MSFWVQQVLEPKRAFRFIVRFKGLTDGASWYATKVTKPVLNVSETEHKYLNHNFYFPGRSTWDPVTVSLVDPATPDAVSELHSILARAGYIIPSNKDELTSISKDRAVASAGIDSTGNIPSRPGGDIEILQIDADGNQDEALVLEKWTLRNAWVKKIAPSELSYDSEDLSTIEIEIRYDWAELKVKDKNTIHEV